MLDTINFSIVRVYAIKMNADVTVILCPEWTKYYPVLSVRKSLVTFHYWITEIK